MTDYMELGKRLVACKGFRWMEGMLGLRWAPGYIDHGKREIRISDSEDARIAKAWGCVPDLSDAATRGCITYLVRELWPQQRWELLGRSHNEIVKKLTWLSGPESEAEVLVSLVGLADEDKE